MEAILLIGAALLSMVGTNIIYDLSSVIVPIAAAVMVIVGIIVGFVVAIKNTISVYKSVYGR